MAEESSVNIQYSWAERIARDLYRLDDLNGLCRSGNFHFLSEFEAGISSLVDYTSSSIDTADYEAPNNHKDVSQRGKLQKHIDTKLEEARNDIEKYMRMMNNNGIPEIAKRQILSRRGREIHQRLRGVLRDVIKELDDNGVLRYIKMNPKEVLKNQWLN